MNREQRRLYNKKNKTNYSKEELDVMEAYDRLKRGNFNMSDLKYLPKDLVHKDNTLLVPDGTKVKLNKTAILSRTKGITEKFISWINKHSDDIFTVTREEGKNSLVCLVEDVEEEENFDEKGNKLPHVKWLFDVYSDLLIQDNKDGEFKELYKIEEESEEETADLKVEAD